MSDEQKPVELLSISEAAARLRVHPNTLRRWADEGIVRSVRPPKPGGHRRFTSTEIARVRAEMRLDEPSQGEQEGKAAA
jgi:excisionase family DNA binding protein